MPAAPWRTSPELLSISQDWKPARLRSRNDIRNGVGTRPPLTLIDATLIFGFLGPWLVLPLARSMYLRIANEKSDVLAILFYFLPFSIRPQKVIVDSNQSEPKRNFLPRARPLESA